MKCLTREWLSNVERRLFDTAIGKLVAWHNKCSNRLGGYVEE